MLAANIFICETLSTIFLYSDLFYFFLFAIFLLLLISLLNRLMMPIIILLAGFFLLAGNFHFVQRWPFSFYLNNILTFSVLFVVLIVFVIALTLKASSSHVEELNEQIIAITDQILLKRVIL